MLKIEGLGLKRSEKLMHLLHFQTRCVDIIVTEFCEGGDLLHSLNRRAKSQNGPPVMPEAEARTVIGQVAKGVSAIHAAGFIHRDIKEANIFISEGSSHQQVPFFMVFF